MANSTHKAVDVSVELPARMLLEKVYVVTQVTMQV